MVQCPICDKHFSAEEVENHVQKCIFLNTQEESTVNINATNTNKRKPFSLFDKSPARAKKTKLDNGTQSHKNTSDRKENKTIVNVDLIEDYQESPGTSKVTVQTSSTSSIPLAEYMRPSSIDNYVGQEHILGTNKVLRNLLEKTEVPSMILWGPPGCGKTTLAHVIANKCKQTQNVRFVKLSATMAGVNDVKDIVKVAKNEQKFKRKTILFMDEIHRFNKLQQDIFLPHVESGVIILIGATTENPSFSLNNALLSRCRVIVLEKLDTDHLITILIRALEHYNGIAIEDAKNMPEFEDVSKIPKIITERTTIKWLAEMCDGDARIALNSLQLAVQSIESNKMLGSKLISLEDIKDGIKRSHVLYDKKGDYHYDTVSALHKSIRASDDNAALYWCSRMLAGGDDPRFVARRLVRAASEDIGLADPQALQLAIAAMHGVQLIGMPECDVILAHCAVYLARAPKSTEVYRAMKECQRTIEECKGNLPAIPLHLRNAPTKLMKDLGYGAGYNMRHKDESNLTYMPEGMENVTFF